MQFTRFFGNFVLTDIVFLGFFSIDTDRNKVKQVLFQSYSKTRLFISKNHNNCENNILNFDFPS